jgi:hypothetical protein
VVLTYNPATQEAEIGGFRSEVDPRQRHKTLIEN